MAKLPFLYGKNVRDVGDVGDVETNDGICYHPIYEGNGLQRAMQKPANGQNLKPRAR